MNVYVVSNGRVESGRFRSMSGDTVKYLQDGALKYKHIRNVFFNERNARRYNLQIHGVFRPILNGTSH